MGRKKGFTGRTPIAYGFIGKSIGGFVLFDIWPRSP